MVRDEFKMFKATGGFDLLLRKLRLLRNAYKDPTWLGSGFYDRTPLVAVLEKL